MIQLCELQQNKIKQLEEVVESLENNCFDEVKKIQKKYDIARHRCDLQKEKSELLLLQIEQWKKHHKSLDDKNFELLDRINELIEESKMKDIKYEMLKKIDEIRQEKLNEWENRLTSCATKNSQ